jgi:hypothetical protein
MSPPLGNAGVIVYDLLVSLLRRSAVGLVRKLTSVSTLGLVNFRSDSEKSSRYAKQTRNAARANVLQNMKMISQQNEQLQQGYQAAAQPAPVPQPPPAGWYEDAQRPGFVRWWDGVTWTEHVQPAPR